MLRDEIGTNTLRQTRFEAFEERLALSADPLTELFTTVRPLDSTFALETPEASYGELSTMANAGQAWTDVSYIHNTYGFTGAGQTVAIIDTGIAWDHPALGGGLGAGKRVVGGWDFAENDANPYDDGPAGFHGTHVAGIVGAQSGTYPGVASGVDLVALRVFDDQGMGHFGWVEQSLQWVLQNKSTFANPITTVNLSIGTNWNADTVPNWANLEDEFLALKNAGIVITVSAGNSFQSYNAPGLSYPAASPYVIPVASVNASGQMSSFSQRNSRVLAAPGEGIVSTVPDYLYSKDGVPNDYAGASGTSMAAPWVAGASALVRQAMQHVGYVGINEDTIYNHLRNTADTIADSVTNASYLRVNLRRAIDNLMTSDDFGNVAAYAHSLGNLGTTPASLSGRIGTTTDVDYFSFVAGTSGTARFTLQASSQITGKWQVDGGPAGTGNTFEFNVVAGQTYFVGLAGNSGGVGTFNLQASVQPPSWGNVDFYLAGGRQATGDTLYSLTATRTGLLTAEAWFAHASGNVDIQILNASQQVLGSSTGTGDSERIDVNVTAGQQLFVRVLGTNSNVTFRGTNLVSASGSTITVAGTAGDDLFTFLPGASTNRVAVNGVGYDFVGSIFNKYYVQGGGGTDTVVVVGTAQAETAAFSAGNAIVNGSNYYFNASGTAYAQMYGNGGSDTATFYDTAANDTFVGSPLSGAMSGAGYSNLAYRFAIVNANFNAGGYDQAFLYGSIGNDRFEASSTNAFLSGTGFRLNTAGFDTVVGVGGWGNDLAILHDTAGDETFIGDATAGSLSGSNFYLRAANFERVESRSTGGNDVAYLWDSAGDDYFAGSNVLAYLNGVGFSNFVQGFDRVTAFSTGGTDSADLYGSAGNDQLVANGRSRRMQAADYVVQTENFRNVKAYGGEGADTASLLDLSYADAINGRSNWIALANGDSLLGYGFEQVTAAAKTGQRPKSDVAAVDYLFNKSGW
jgi:subtilisin family serine protease